MQYRIYYADMAKAVCKEKKKRPVVVVAEPGSKVTVHCVTCRNKQDRPSFYVPLNNYLVSGNVEVSHYYWINKKFLLNYVRDCTSSEQEAIYKGCKRWEKPNN